MNKKMKNYVDVLFADIPQTKNAVELKEEILSNLNEHFEALVAEGKSENQAYTESLAEIGDIDELLASLAPERELKPKIEAYRKKRAGFTATAVGLYFMAGVLFFGFSAIASGLHLKNSSLYETVGIMLMLLFCGIATGLLVFINMSVPQDVAPYVEAKKKEWGGNVDERAAFWKSFFGLFWMVAVIVYLLVSFSTGAWHITWIIFLIGGAIRQALKMIFNLPDE